DVRLAVTVAVDSVRPPGGRHELHGAERPGAGGPDVAPVVALDLPDGGQDRPREAVAGGRRLLVELEVAAGLAVRGALAALGLVVEVVQVDDLALRADRLAQAGLQRVEVGAGRVDEEPDVGHQTDPAAGVAADEDVDAGQSE